MRKSIFDKIFEKFPNRFPDKPNKKEKKRIYDQAFVYCSREYESEWHLKPKRVDIEECLLKRIVFLLGLYQEYRTARTDLEIRQIQRKKKRTLAFGLVDISGHSEKCNCPDCNPPFAPFGDDDERIRGLKEDERRIEAQKEAQIINEGLRERFDSMFCPNCHRQLDCCICGDD